jgi:hypothetical protein
MKKLLLFLLPMMGAVWLLSCDREYSGPTVIQGQVIELATGTPIVNAVVYATALESSGVPGFPDYRTLDSVLTDAEGRYKIVIEDDDNLDLLSMLIHKDGYDIKKNIGALPRIVNTVDVVLEPLGSLNVQFKNIKKLYGTFRISSELGTLQKDYYGLDVDSSLLCTGNANRSCQLSFLILNSDGNWEYLSKESIYITGHDTTNYTFTY